MKVNELIEKLKDMPLNAEVYLETWREADSNEVRLYTDGNDNFVYIGDNFEELDMDYEDQGYEIIKK